MNNRAIVSDDGGKTHRLMNEKNKHVDNHAMAFKADDVNYVLFGTDGGLYESFDDTKTWRYVANLPVTQFYKLALDDAEPFYHVYGGTQDNNTQRGPVRTDNVQGIRNSDWTVVLFGDGHQPATEPGNPDIVYAQWQQGNLVRYDNTTGEMVYIQPQGKTSDAPDRFNWDAPILVSPHDPKRLYFASQRVWQSDDRGDSWRAISGDLTKNQERITLPIMGKQQSWDNPWDVFAMSKYNTITSLAESPLKPGLIYAGTDDGLIQVSQDGGENWKQIEVGDLPGVPDTAFVNDIKADLFDQDTVYVALDNHKYGDFKPYLLVSRNQGKSWQSLAKNLPDKHLVWRLVQDHVDPKLLFVGTEFGVFVSTDAGRQWHQLKGGLPTISIRDLAIQKRENDLVLATFGRGFYVLDDYSRLRNLQANTLQTAQLFPVRDAWWYFPRVALGFSPKASQGDAFYQAKNPDFGAALHYYLPEGLKSAQAKRQKAEKAKKGADVEFPGWDAVDAELTADQSQVWLTIKNASGDVVRRLTGPTKPGFHQVTWDLRLPAKGVVTTKAGGFGGEPRGIMAPPGTYTASISQWHEGELTPLSVPQTFEVKPMRTGALTGASHTETAEFWAAVSDAQHDVAITREKLKMATERLQHVKKALARSQTLPGTHDQALRALAAQLHEAKKKISGSPAKAQIGELGPDTASDLLGAAFMGTTFSSYGPTANHRQALEQAVRLNQQSRESIETVDAALRKLAKTLEAAGAPWVPN